MFFIKSTIRRLILVCTVFAFAASLFVSCRPETAREIIDRSGRPVQVSGTINRVVSTAPSNTEIIVDLGLASKLVAVDVHSADISGLPSDLLYLDFFYPDAEALVSLNPDLILASGHNPTGTGDDPFRLLREMGIAVAYISMSESIDDIYLDIAFVADLLQAGEAGENLINSMKSQVAEIAQKSAGIVNRKSVYLEISAAPYMMTFGRGSYIDDMITVIGAYNIFGSEDWLVMPGAESVISLNPDVILTTVDYIEDPIAEIKSRPGFEHIDAVKNNQIYQLDTNSAVRNSARIILALRQMSQAVYPELW